MPIQQNPVSIGILVFPNFQLLDATGPAGVFDVANHTQADSYVVTMLSAEGGLVSSSGGVAIDTQAIGRQRVDTLLVVGGQGTEAACRDLALIAFIQRQFTQCRRICSVCSGTYLLAVANVLDGLNVTTHWRESARLANLFPQLNVEADRIWVRDGKVWTSAGVTAGIDLALALVTEDCGETVAKQTAREIVMYYKRPGGQSQFSIIEELSDRDNRFKPVLAWIREHIAEPIKVDHLADVAAMSPRNFSRQFQKALGRTPAKVVEQIRAEEAIRLVESTDLTMEQIAQRCGFSHGEIMRRAFVRLYGRAPRAVRMANI